MAELGMMKKTIISIVFKKVLFNQVLNVFLKSFPELQVDNRRKKLGNKYIFLNEKFPLFFFYLQFKLYVMSSFFFCH